MRKMILLLFTLLLQGCSSNLENPKEEVSELANIVLINEDDGFMELGTRFHNTYHNSVEFTLYENNRGFSDFFENADVYNLTSNLINSSFTEANDIDISSLSNLNTLHMSYSNDKVVTFMFNGRTSNPVVYMSFKSELYQSDDVGAELIQLLNKILVHKGTILGEFEPIRELDGVLLLKNVEIEVTSEPESVVLDNRIPLMDRCETNVDTSGRVVYYNCNPGIEVSYVFPIEEVYMAYAFEYQGRVLTIFDAFEEVPIYILNALLEDEFGELEIYEVEFEMFND